MHASVEKRWQWTGKTRRHYVLLKHNVISGSQYLEVDGEVLHKVSWKYKLTGTLYFNTDSSVVELYIRADDYGNLKYVLTVDTKEVPLHEDRVVSTWVVATADGLHQVEFEHKSFDILLDGHKVDAVGDFLEEGSAYAFSIGGKDATLVVIPATHKKSHMKTTLTVGAVEVAQSETLGSDASPAGSPSADAGNDWGRVELKPSAAAPTSGGAAAAAAATK